MLAVPSPGWPTRGSKINSITHEGQGASLTAPAEVIREANKLTSTISVCVVIWLRISTHSTLSILLINALRLVETTTSGHISGAKIELIYSETEFILAIEQCTEILVLGPHQARETELISLPFVAQDRRPPDQTILRTPLAMMLIVTIVS
jgi:hypothetical protein